MQFEYYVLNYDCNKKKVENFNIFRNCLVQEHTEKAVRKYLRSPKNYKYVVQHKNDFLGREEIVVYGFDALVKEIDSIIAWQERGRREYEVSVGDAFITEIRDIVREVERGNLTNDNLYDELMKTEQHNAKLEKWDCYEQAKPNMKMITYEVIRQYKEQKKKAKDGE